VYTYNTATGVREAQRRRIVSNTSTQLTVASAWDSNPAAGTQYNIGGILLDWRTGFRDGSAPMFRKRIEFAFLNVSTTSVGTECEIEFFRNQDEDNPLAGRTLGIGTASLWDDAEFDEDVFAGGAIQVFRIPIRTTGYSWQTRVCHLSTGEQLYIQRLGVQWLSKTKHTDQSLT
jgi:hypothetical protein